MISMNVPSSVSLVSEISLLKSRNLFYLIPNYLYTYFKDEFNDRILVNLIEKLTELSQNENIHKNIFSISVILNDSVQKYYNCISEILTFIEHERKYFTEVSQQQQIPLEQQSLFQQIQSNLPTNEQISFYQRSILIQNFNAKFYGIFSALFQKVFDVYHVANNQSNEDESNYFTSSCSICNPIDSACKCNMMTEVFHSINRVLFELQLFDHLCGDIIVEVLQNKIKDHIEKTSLDNFEETFIESFEKWLDTIVIGWIKHVYSSSNSHINKNLDKNVSFERYLINYKKQLAHFLYTHYAHSRISRLFDIIIDYPDSKNAVDDLKLCLQKTNLRSNVIKQLKHSIEQRLLHPGVNTSDILTAYVSAIKALMILDPSGVMMENICEPLKKYLRNREDTVKCIVSNLIDESSSDLMEEFCKEIQSDEATYGDSNAVSNFELNKNWRLWQPDPVDANPVSFNSENSKPDIISMLVNIYGSKDMFVNEYKSLLADRLLSSYSYNMEKEIRYLELLRLRFGDSNLFCCEAMLRDISESKRINANVIEQLHQKGKLDKSQLMLKCIILSEQFWPKLKEENIELPRELKEIQEKFTSSYEALKGNRTLLWKNNLGQVTIDIELSNNRTIEFNVTPVQAAVIIKFQEKETWSLQELSQSLKMCSFGLRKKLMFWCNQGIIKLDQSELADESAKGSLSEAQEIYSLVKDYSTSKKAKVVIEDEEEAEQKVTQKNEGIKEQDLHLYWNYTQNMLRGFGCLPLERIHALLKMYANPDISLEQVKAMLELKIKEQLVKYNAGIYRLNK